MMAEMPLASRVLLIVDDDLQQIDLLRQLLSRHGYRIYAVKSAQEALAFIRQTQEHLDMVISDVTMPDMSGVELARSILAERPNLPVILLSGVGVELDSDSVPPNVVDTLQKPYRSRLLANRIEQILGDKKK